MKIDGKALLEDLKKHVKIEVDLDGFALAQVDKLVVPAVDSLLVKLNKLIPGPIDDAIVAQIKPQLYEQLREELAKALQKVEDKIEDVVKGDSDEAKA